MRPLIHIFLLLLSFALWPSCRSSRQAAIERADTAAVTLRADCDEIRADDIVTYIAASRNLSLSNITVEFYPPDSAHPDACPAPSSIHIEAATASASESQATQHTSDTSTHAAVNAASHSASASKEASRSDYKTSSPSDLAVALSILALIVLLILLLIKHLRQ